MGSFIKSTLLGYEVYFTVIFVWSFWLIVCRLGAASPLTSYDLAAMRYGFSAIVSLHFAIYFKPWKNLSFLHFISFSFILGPINTLTVFSGFSYAPAVHGGIFMNELLPIFSVLVGLVFSAKLDQEKLQAH